MTIDSTWVLGFIMVEKNKNLDELLITKEEYNKILDILTKKYNLKINTYIDNYFFKYNNNIFELNDENGVRTSDFVSAINLIESDKFLKLIKRLNKIISNEFKKIKLDIDYTSLEYVIKRIVPDERKFYIDAALTLTESEYNYIRDCIRDKNCTNCTNNKCIKMFLDEKSRSCSFWDNEELIGKEKVLSKF